MKLGENNAPVNIEDIREPTSPTDVFYAIRGKGGGETLYSKRAKKVLDGADYDDDGNQIELNFD